jgi:hypothetical protein
MEKEEFERIKNIIKIFKILDYSEEDMQKVLKLKKSELTNLIKYYNII